jgi:hypothetical protein
MGIKELEFANENIEQLAEIWLEQLRGEPIQPQHVLTVCQLTRRRACGLLLANYDAESFLEELFHAADVFLQLLERNRRRPGMDPYFLSRGHAEPLLDALAAGSVPLAQRMDALLETRWQPELEYPEDFRFFMLLPKVAAPETPQAELLEGLDQLEQALEGAEYPRYDVLKALVHASASDFEDALVAAISAYQARMDRERKSGTGNPLGLMTDANLFIEGIAFVRLARARGLRTRSQYPLIPPAALVPPRPPGPRRPIWGG